MKRKKSFFLWLFLLILLTTYNFDSKENLVNSFFKIKTIEIEGIQNSDRKEIEEIIGSEFTQQRLRSW